MERLQGPRGRRATATAGVDADAWRGVAAEDLDELPAQVSARLRRRSRRLLASLLAPRRSMLLLAVAFILVRTAGTLAIPYLVGQAIDLGIRANRPAVLELYAGAVVAAALAAAGGNWAFLRVAGRLGQDFLYELRMRVYSHVQELSISFYERYTSGRIISRLTNDVDTLTDLLATGLTSLATASLSIAAIAVVLLLLDWRLGAVTLLSFPLILLLTQWFRTNSSRAYRSVRQAIALVIVHFTESLGGIRAVQAYSREERNQQIFEELNARYRDANALSVRLSATYAPGISLLGRLATLAVLAFGGLLVLRGSLTLGILTAFVLYVRQFFEPMQDLTQFYNLFQAAAAALEKLAGVLEERPAVPEPAHPKALGQGRGSIEFAEVTFAYQEAPVLRELSFSVPAGQTLALVGRTGAGKSSIARLMARFYDPREGAVRLDGLDLRDISRADLRRSVVMVTQESFLFSGSIADNIRFGRPEASSAEIEEAARAVGAHSFVARLPQGYDTPVRRRGVRLSAGQRQLVAFARAFLAQPRVLILDEATSSLDVPSERLVQHALRTLLAGRTAVIIAHRLSTVAIADRVLVVEEGELVEDGPPQALARSPGRFQELQQAWHESLV